MILFSVSNAVGQDTLETIQLEMDLCINLSYDVHTRVANTRKELESIVRTDMSRELCMEKLQDLDMEKFSLLGININSGSCTVPPGLKFTTVKLDDEKKYLFEVSYNLPVGLCAAYRTYDLWVKVPSLPDGYEVEFKIVPRKTEN